MQTLTFQVVVYNLIFGYLAELKHNFSCRHFIYMIFIINAAL